MTKKLITYISSSIIAMSIIYIILCNILVMSIISFIKSDYAKTIYIDFKKCIISEIKDIKQELNTKETKHDN